MSRPARLLVLLLLAMATGLGGADVARATGAACPDRDLSPASGRLDAVAAATLCLVNGERADAGLGPLAPDPELTRAALAHSREMVAAGYFSHTGGDGSSAVDRIRATGYIPTDRAWTVGENLAWGTGTLATPEAIVAAWMRSPGHRDNVLRPVFREIGLGVVAGNPQHSDGAGATYATTFGSLGGGATAASAPAASHRHAVSRRARAAAHHRKARARRARAASHRRRARARAASHRRRAKARAVRRHRRQVKAHRAHG